VALFAGACLLLAAKVYTDIKKQDIKLLIEVSFITNFLKCFFVCFMICVSAVEHHRWVSYLDQGAASV